MEGLPYSDNQRAAEFGYSQPNSGDASVYRGEPICLDEIFKLQDDHPLNHSLLKIGGSQLEKQGQVQQTVSELLTNSYCQNPGALFSDNLVKDQHKSCSLHDIENNDTSEPRSASENPLAIVIVKSASPNTGREEALSFSEPAWLKGEESMALWVKWRGMWQAAIKCARVDYPLSTLKAKPTHDRKNYFVIFFPHTRNHSWADMLLVRPIDEFPEPVVHRTHQEGLKMVKDLTVGRRFIMQKLAVAILNVVDQLHSNALMETACDVSLWKEFVMEASHSNAYLDLGRMLLKLQNGIVPHYINLDWFKYSSCSWAERCRNANSAESIELLKEELCDSILWSDVNNLWGAPVQPTLGSEWKTWKHDVTKWFSASPSFSSNKAIQQQQTPDSACQVRLQIGRKRQKLDIRRRAVTHTPLEKDMGSDHSITPETNPGFFQNQNSVNALETETFEPENAREVPVATELPSNLTGDWHEVQVEGANSEILHSNGMESPSIDEMDGQNTMEPGTKNQQQCAAYVEAKGRQCVRSANDGDELCCVHSRCLASSRKAGKPVPIENPICEGITIAGNRCKFHSLPDSPFCKKHLPRAETNNTSNSTHRTRKRKREENHIGSSQGLICKDMVLVNAESPLQTVHGDFFFDELSGELVLYGNDHNAMEAVQCIGSPQHGNEDPCLEAPKWHLLYCEKHVPGWLKRARNGMNRIISKEVFTEILRDCCSWEQKVHLHQACEIFYRLFKGIINNPDSKEVQFQCTLTEASKDPSVGELLKRLMSSEKDRIKLVWGLDNDIDTLMGGLSLLPTAINDRFDNDNDNTVTCKICNAEFPDDKTLGSHWMDNHKLEAESMFRGYACAMCLDSFTDKKLLETHVEERHHEIEQFGEQCMLVQCIPCGSHFGNMEKLWFHIPLAHSDELKPLKALTCPPCEASQQNLEQGNSASLDNNSQDLREIPDLGRHRQAAHMEKEDNEIGRKSAKGKVLNSALRLKPGRLGRPKFKKGSASTSHQIKSRANANIRKRIKETKSLVTRKPTVQPNAAETTNNGELTEYQSTKVANVLFSEIQKTAPKPNNLDILSIVRSACCKVSLKASLEEKYWTLPESVYLEAAKLCSKYDIAVSWHQEGFMCPNGCQVLRDQRVLAPLASHTNCFVNRESDNIPDPATFELEADEFHYVINARHFESGSLQKDTVLCDDISFGKESIPVICVVDQETLNSLRKNGFNEQDMNLYKPWESFTYVTKPRLHQSPSLPSESLQLGCNCSSSTCWPEKCDHVYLFDTDFDDAKDIFQKPMRGRFPYELDGRIILEEGYPVYECNHKCGCNKTCQNRILQNGIQVLLEVFKTEKKGWGLRAGEDIPRGTFICEVIGEVINKEEANNRSQRDGKENCSYVYDIDACVKDMSKIFEGHTKCAIDTALYGNVSRFINGSCSPNLVSYRVIVESTDCESSRIGLYASRDIALGEELTFDYHNKLVPGEGSPCLCGSPECRGRLY